MSYIALQDSVLVDAFSICAIFSSSVCGCDTLLSEHILQYQVVRDWLDETVVLFVQADMAR